MKVGLEKRWKEKSTLARVCVFYVGLVVVAGKHFACYYFGYWFLITWSPLCSALSTTDSFKPAPLSYCCYACQVFHSHTANMWFTMITAGHFPLKHLKKCWKQGFLILHNRYIKSVLFIFTLQHLDHQYSLRETVCSTLRKYFTKAVLQSLSQCSEQPGSSACQWEHRAQCCVAWKGTMIMSPMLLL